MKRYLIAYSAWLSFVAIAAFIAALWYRHVEAIGWREVADKLKADTDDGRDD